MSDTEGKNGSPARSRSRSASRSKSKSYDRSRSRSRSRSGSARRSRSRTSGSRGRRPSYRSRSRSPMSKRRRHMGNRDDPEPNRCLGIFGLSLYTQERDVKDMFSRYGPLDKVQVVYDHQTGRSRGFAFVYYEEIEDAIEAKERCNGIELDGRRIRVDFSVTERAHTPTPGIYLGKPTRTAGYGRRKSPSPRRRRSPSPYNRRRYSRSRSRSRTYSPRRY